MKEVDLILKARWLIPIDHHDRVLEHTAIIIKDGKIIAIEPNDQVDQLFAATETRILDKHAVMPGFVNSHTHLPMSLLRGLADDLPLMKWLEEHIWPVERKCVSPEFVKAGAELAIAELIRGGVTCFNEMYFYENEIAKVANDIGIRGRVAESVLDFEMPWSKNGDECLERVIDNIQFIKDFPLIDAAIAPHSPYATSRAHLEATKKISEDYDVPVHIHLQESTDEVEQIRVLHKMRPTQYLNDIGLINSRLIAVHMTQANSQDRDIFKNGGAHIVHCPESNMKLSSGSCPVQMMLDGGVNVALGTDGAASNNDLDMFGEMRSAAFMAKLIDENPEALSANTVLKMATQNGAAAMGYGKQIGSLQVGFDADMIAIDLDRLETSPVYNPISQIVYAACREQVTDVWVQGKQLLKNRELLTINETKLKATVENWRTRII